MSKFIELTVDNNDTNYIKIHYGNDDEACCGENRTDWTYIGGISKKDLASKLLRILMSTKPRESITLYTR